MPTNSQNNKTAIVAFRTHQNIKDKVGKVLAKSGLDTSTVLNLVMQNIALTGKSPITLDRTMSPKLIKIIKRAEQEDKSKQKRFNSSREAVAFLSTF